MSPALREPFLPVGVQGRIFMLETCLSLDGAPGTYSLRTDVLGGRCRAHWDYRGQGRGAQLSPYAVSVSHDGSSLARKLFVVINREPLLRFVSEGGTGRRGECLCLCAFICNLASTLSPQR